MTKLLINDYELDIKSCNIHHVFQDCDRAAPGSPDRDLVWLGFDYFKKVAQGIIDNIIAGKYKTKECHE